MARIRTNKEARRLFPRTSFANLSDFNDFPGCDLKVWSHRLDCNGRPEVGGYLKRYECNDAGEVVARHDVWSEATQSPMFLWVPVTDLRRD